MTRVLLRRRGLAPGPGSARRALTARRLGVALLAVVGLAAGAGAQDPCLECHGLLGLGLQGRSLWVHREVFENGVHGRLACSDCHKGYDAFPHAARRESRCDLPCHVVGASHEDIVRGEQGGAHARAASPGCAACHTGGAAPRGREVEARCRGCHGSLDAVDAVFPSGAGSFGRRAHAESGEAGRLPGCVACHGAHGIRAGEEARKSCSQGACHPGSGVEFARLFSHRPEGARRPWGGAGPAALALGALVGAFLFLHSARAKP